jgi:hypothetical protein
MRPSLRSPIVITVLVMTTTVLVAAAWSFVEPHTLEISRSVVTSPDVPAEFDGIRMVFLSDIHAGPFFDERRVSNLVDAVSSQRPHLILLGGDYVGGHQGGAEIFYPHAARLRAPLGVVAVMGNHDVWEGGERSRSELASAGVLLLENRNARVMLNGAWIRIAGVEDLLAGRPDLEAAASDIAADEFAVLVSHHPDVLAGISTVADAFDLALAGHTHGGQVNLLGLYAPIVPSDFGQRYRGGWLWEGDVPVLVSRGIGTIDLPVRFFSRPQIHVIELRKGEASVRQQAPRR